MQGRHSVPGRLGMSRASYLIMPHARCCLCALSTGRHSYPPYPENPGHCHHPRNSNNEIYLRISIHFDPVTLTFAVLHSRKLKRRFVLLENISRIREAMPATSTHIYLNTGTFGPLPACV